MTTTNEIYRRGQIYTIRCRYDDSLVYVGSTIQPLAKRMSSHRNNIGKEEKRTTTLTRAVNGDWDNWYIELYENYPCNNKQELERREGEVIRQIGTINKFIAGRTKKEYYEDNRDKLAEKITCYCGCEVSRRHLKRHQQSYACQDFLRNI